MIALGGVLPIIGFGPVLGLRVKPKFLETARGTDRVCQFVDRDHGISLPDRGAECHAGEIPDPCRTGTTRAAR